MLRRLARQAGALFLAIALGISPGDADSGDADMMVAVTPETGWWWTPEESGRGIAIEATGSSGVFAGVLVYAEDGAPIWHVVDATGPGATKAGDLQAFVGGQTLTGAYRPNAFLGSAGTASFTFDGPRSGVLTWPGGATRIERYGIVPGGIDAGPAAGAPPAGWWFNASESGRGFFTEVQGDTLFLLTTMYDDLGRAVWYTARGPMTTPAFFQGELTQVSGGQTMGGDYRPPNQVASYGTITFQIVDDARALITLPGGRQASVMRYGVCLELQRRARPTAGPVASASVLPDFPWPGCGGEPSAP